MLSREVVVAIHAVDMDEAQDAQTEANNNHPKNNNTQADHQLSQADQDQRLSHRKLNEECGDCDGTVNKEGGDEAQDGRTGSSTSSGSSW